MLSRSRWDMTMTAACLRSMGASSHSGYSRYLRKHCVALTFS